MAACFCPKCWRHIERGAAKCASCGYDTVEYSHLPYEQKLLLALGHPIRENRLLAVQLLGELRSGAALPFFQNMLDVEDDFYLLREILIALTKIGSSEARSALWQATKHESRIVRDFAKMLMDRRKPRPGPAGAV